MTISRNVSGQKFPVFAYDKTTGAPEPGDAANITAQISKDYGASAATNDVNPTELEATDQKGIYLFDATQSETDADVIILSAVSATANILVEPLIVFTQPKLFTFGTASGVPTTTTVPTTLTEATSDHYKNAFILFTSGVCAGQKSKVSAYDGATKTLTVATLTDSPTAGDQFVLIGGTA